MKYTIQAGSDPEVAIWRNRQLTEAEARELLADFDEIFHFHGGNQGSYIIRAYDDGAKSGPFSTMSSEVMSQRYSSIPLHLECG